MKHLFTFCFFSIGNRLAPHGVKHGTIIAEDLHKVYNNAIKPCFRNSVTIYATLGGKCDPENFFALVLQATIVAFEHKYWSPVIL